MTKLNLRMEEDVISKELKSSDWNNGQKNSAMYICRWYDIVFSCDVVFSMTGQVCSLDTQTAITVF